MENIKVWYRLNYSDDPEGKTIDDNATFTGLFEALDDYVCVYEYIFGDTMLGDSIIRERVFTQLASIMGVPYDYIYDQWLLGASVRRDRKERGA